MKPDGIIVSFSKLENVVIRIDFRKWVVSECRLQ